MSEEYHILDSSVPLDQRLRTENEQLTKYPITTSRLLSNQVAVVFSGNPASQEINGTFGAVPCESVFSAASAAALGAGNTCQFTSSSTIMVCRKHPASRLPIYVRNSRYRFLQKGASSWAVVISVALSPQLGTRDDLEHAFERCPAGDRLLIAP